MSEITPNSLNSQNDIKNEKLFTWKNLLILLLSWFILAIIHNYLLFWFSNWPWIFIFSILFIITIFIHSKIFKLNLFFDFYIITFSLLLFSFFKMIRVWEILNFLNNIAIFFFYLFLVKIVIKSKLESFTSYDYFPWFIKTFFWWIMWIGIWIWSILKIGFNFPNFEKKKHILKGIFMSIPLIFIFSVLFSSADLVFQKFLNSFLNFDFLNFINVTDRLINISLLSLIIIWFLTYIFFQINWSLEINNQKKFQFDEKKHIEISIVLTIISILFFIFVILQIWYLFSWENYIISQWYTYSEYAKKWFVELAFCVFIVFILLWKIDEYLYWHQKVTSNLYKTLATILISLTILILFSALYRLWLYENAYWFTEIRFYGYLFIIILFCSLSITLFKILFFVKEWIFISINLYFYFLWLIFANIFNPEAFITQYNTNKIYSSSLRTDFFYIWERSFDAIDNILSSYWKANKKDKTMMEKKICNMIRTLQERNTDWRGYNYAFSHADKVLLPFHTQLNCSNNVFITNPKNTSELHE